MSEPLTVETIREMKRQLASRDVLPKYRKAPYFMFVHPRAGWMVWQWLGLRKFGFKMWLDTFRYLTLKEWWSDRPWSEGPNVYR